MSEEMAAKIAAKMAENAEKWLKKTENVCIECTKWLKKHQETK